MESQEKFEYWLDIAQYDLVTAEAQNVLVKTKEAFTWLMTLKP